MKAIELATQGAPNRSPQDQWMRTTLPPRRTNHWAAFGAAAALICSWPAFANDYYDYDVVAQIGQSALTGMGDRPSINSQGTVAFVGQTSGGEAIFVGKGGGLLPQNVTSSFVSTSGRFFGRGAWINDRDEIAGYDRVNNTQGGQHFTQIRRWDASGVAGPVKMGEGGPSRPQDEYDIVYDLPCINNIGQFVFSACPRGSSSTTALITQSGVVSNVLVFPFSNPIFRPEIADSGHVVVRAGSLATSPIHRYLYDLSSGIEIANTSMGFTQIGRSPGITDDGSIVAFAGNRGNGQGVFVSLEDSFGTRIIVRVAGENQGPGGPRAELGTDDQGQPLYFSSISVDDRVAVIRDELGDFGLKDDNIVVCFVGTPNAASGTNDPIGLKFNSARGLWTVRLSVTPGAVVPSVLEFAPVNPLPVIQIGDSILTSGGMRAVDNISVFDQLARARSSTPSSIQLPRIGDHRVCYHATSGAEQFIVRATPCPCSVNQAFPRPQPRSLSDQDAQNGWSMDIEVSDDDGLVLKNIRLRDRYMAREFGIPYLRIESSGFTGRLELKPNGNGQSGRSRLVDFKAGSIPDQPNAPFGVEATYLIDGIGKSCLRVTQQYLFYPLAVFPGGLVPSDRVEPSACLVAQRFFPLVKYEFCPKGNESLQSLRVAQRLHFQADGASANASIIARDILVTIQPEFPFFDFVTDELRNRNPLDIEASAKCIVNGKHDDSGQTLWDNLHQTYNSRVEEPAENFPLLKGCPECVHIHWRWFDLTFPSIPIPVTCDFPYVFQFLGYPFDGEPIIPKKVRGYSYDSNQDLEVGILQFHDSEDERDPLDYLLRIDGEPVGSQDQVFWYVSTGKRNEDQFFVHGGFFAPVKTSAVASRIEDGMFKVFINAPPGASASIQESTDAMQTWTAVSTFTVTSSVMSFSYPLRNSGAVFYRAVLLP